MHAVEEVLPSADRILTCLRASEVPEAISKSNEYLWSILTPQNAVTDDDVLRHKMPLLFRVQVPYAQHVAAVHKALQHC